MKVSPDGLNHPNLAPLDSSWEKTDEDESKTEMA